MGFEDSLNKLSTTIKQQKNNVTTEEATKNAFILPFLDILGYNIFNPTEVVPEFVADIGIKKGEKVDYAIMEDGDPILLIECKSCDKNLDKAHASQLYRYFSVTPARFGILTNGIQYSFFTDIDKSNMMDKKPFYEINLLKKIEEESIEELQKFTKSSFDVDKILYSASNIKYRTEMQKVILKELENPSKEFIKLLTRQVYEGVITENVYQRFRKITKPTIQKVVNDKVNRRLQKAIKDVSVPEEDTIKEETPERIIITTEEEFEGYFIVKTILHDVVDIDRVNIRDKITYCGVLLDNNNRKPLCRLHFNTKQKYIGLFDNDTEEKIPIAQVKEIYNYGDRLKNTAKKYNI
jgi:hypothetical protein